MLSAIYYSMYCKSFTHCIVCVSFIHGVHVIHPMPVSRVFNCDLCIWNEKSNSQRILIKVLIYTELVDKLSILVQDCDWLITDLWNVEGWGRVWLCDVIVIVFSGVQSHVIDPHFDTYRCTWRSQRQLCWTRHKKSSINCRLVKK